MRHFVERLGQVAVAIALGGCSTPSLHPAEAATCTVGIVDVARAARESKAGRASLEQLDNERAGVRASFQQRLDAPGCRVPFNWPIPPGSVFADSCGDLYQLQLDMAEAHSDLRARERAHEERLQAIRQAARDAAARVGEKAGCSLVLDPEESSIAWWTHARDLTDNVIHELDSQPPE